MTLKSRINTIERNLKPKGNAPEWKEHVKRLEEMDSLYPLIEEGNLDAAIRYIRLLDQSEKWRNRVAEYIESLGEYRDKFVEIFDMDYEAENFMDIWIYNMKAAYDYLERLKSDPKADKPKLKVLNHRS